MSTTRKARPAAEPAPTMSIKDIRMNPDNPRLIKDAKFAKLVKSLQDFPQMFDLRPIVIDEKNMVLGGNMRLKAAKEIGLLEVPIKRAVGLSKEQKKEFIVKDNLNYGEWDWDQLVANWDTTRMEDWGVDLPEAKIERKAEEDDYEIPEELPTDIKPGDIITIGEHRLLCGDACEAASFTLLMAGDKADLIFTDPPYGVSYLAGRVGGQKKSAFQNLYAFSQPDIAAYVWYASRTHVQFEKALKEAGFEVNQQLIWNKGMSLGHSDYHWAHEPVLYCKKASGKTTWYGDRTEKTILGPKRSELLSLKKEELIQIVKNLLDNSTNWEIDRDHAVTYKHPTQKPVPLAGRAIINSSKDRAIVADCFLGSGSTMVACHQLGRICYAMDLEPRNCQITVNRMRKLAAGIEVTVNGKTVN